MDKPTAVKDLAAVSRRRFVKTFALGTAASSLLGKAWQASVLADITPSGPGLLRIKLSDYPALLENFGSVRIGINPIDEEFLIEVYGPFFPVMINHNAGVYYAMNTFCNHAGCVVKPFLERLGRITCCHGSEYGIDGSLLTGPATLPLTPFPVTFDGVDTLTVEVANLGYTVESTLVQSGSTPRLQLDFWGHLNVEYEVYFREHATDAWTVIPFSRTLDGVADQTSMLGEFSFFYENGSPASVFVNRTTQTGFYSIGIKPFEIPYNDPNAFVNFTKV
jgi:Rieske Fe-S protein